MLKGKGGVLEIDAKEFTRLLDKWATLQGIAKNTGHSYDEVKEAYRMALKEEFIEEEKADEHRRYEEAKKIVEAYERKHHGG